MYCRYKYFESLPKYPIDKPVIGMASKYLGSYEDQLNASEKESRKHWVSDKSFRTIFGKMSGLGAKEKYNDLYYVNTGDLGVAPKDITCRDNNPENFLFGHFKKF